MRRLRLHAAEPTGSEEAFLRTAGGQAACEEQVQVVRKPGRCVGRPGACVVS